MPKCKLNDKMDNFWFLNNFLHAILLHLQSTDRVLQVTIGKEKLPEVVKQLVDFISEVWNSIRKKTFSTSV